MWINQNSCARKDVVTTATLLGRVSAPSAGGRSTTKPGRSRFRRTGNWQSGKRTYLGVLDSDVTGYAAWRDTFFTSLLSYQQVSLILKEMDIFFHSPLNE